MENQEQLMRALVVALYAHEGQRDKSGKEYFLHPLRMMVRMLQDNHSVIACCVALLHDVLEDTAVTEDGLKAAGIGSFVIEAVRRMTRQPNETYTAYMTRVVGDKTTSLVKGYDIRDNMDEERLLALDPREADRLRAKYRDGLRMLAGRKRS